MIPTSNSTATRSGPRYKNSEGFSSSRADTFAKLGESALPPFPPGADFGNYGLLRRFAREGDAVLVGSKFDLLVRSCAKRGYFDVLSWMLARTGTQTLKFKIQKLVKAERLQPLMEWTRTLPVKLNLELSCSGLVSHPAELTEGLKHNPNIRGMHIDCEPGDVDKLAELHFHAFVLESLATCPSLETLYCRMSDPDIRNLTTLLKETESLTSLSLQISHIPQPFINKHFSELGSAFAACRTLTRFHISSNNLPLAFRPEWDLVFSRLLASPYLQTLTLEDWKPTPAGMAAFAQALKKNSTLQSLSITLSELTDADAKVLAEGLKGNSSLTELRCVNCRLQAEGVTALLSVAGSHTRIRKLDVSMNCVQAKAMGEVASALLQNRSLEFLVLGDSLYDLGENHSNFVRDLVPAIRANGRLRLLCISSRNLSQDILQMLSLRQLHQEMPHLEIQLDGKTLDWEQHRVTVISKLHLLKTVAQIDGGQSGPDTGRAPGSDIRLRQEDWDALRPLLDPPVSGNPWPRPENALRPITASHFEAIDSTRARYISTSDFPGFDLTDDTGTITRFTTLVRDELIISGKQRYEPEFDRVFPIRHPGNPSLVHPDYANENDPRKCGGKVRLRGIGFYKDSGASMSKSYLWNELKKNFPGHRIPDQEALIALIKQSATAEIEATLHGKFPPSARSLSVVKLTREQCDDENEADMLAGQYGVVLANYAADQQPSLDKGRIAGIFAGGMMRTPEDRDLYEAAYGEQAAKDYGAEVRKYGGGGKDMIGWNPYGGGNALQFLNSTFVLHTDGEMRVDSGRTNAILFPLRLELIDRHGHERTETMLAVIQVRLVAQGKQLKLDYGPEYRLQLQAARNALRPVKQEGSTH
ncbi:leucine-rich repeat domain-containing protein [Noviherbaspirillum pedocola]|uniref:Uncharacterized protein n=1 Tax=Noviherbaspirillum pedocola TaxID=2801341 RepID=A0A934W3S9_9BURK|nr:hypothetical protein [Noviherbaspirillum pedocola]MBK4737771.1 hypothetical protein [Noviherbaspirillum pedocola]